MTITLTHISILMARRRGGGGGGGGGGPYVPPTFLALNLTPGGYTAPSVSSVSLNLAN